MNTTQENGPKTDNQAPPINQVQITVYPDGRVSLADSARFIGVQPETLRNTWRKQNKGPRLFKVGGRWFSQYDGPDGLKAFANSEAA